MRDDLPNKKLLLDFSRWNCPPAKQIIIIKAMSDQATFVETYTIEQFKSEVGASKIELLPSKNYKPGVTGKYFISDSAGNSVATVSKKITEASDLTEPVVSLMIGDDGKEFYLMHNRGNGGIEAERTW